MKRLLDQNENVDFEMFATYYFEKISPHLNASKPSPPADPSQPTEENISTPEEDHEHQEVQEDYHEDDETVSWIKLELIS